MYCLVFARGSWGRGLTNGFGVLVCVAEEEVQVDLVRCHVHEGEGLIVLSYSDDELQRGWVSLGRARRERRVLTTVDPNLTDCERDVGQRYTLQNPHRILYWLEKQGRTKMAV